LPDDLETAVSLDDVAFGGVDFLDSLHGMMFRREKIKLY
jgi:hypothetical protein